MKNPYVRSILITIYLLFIIWGMLALYGERFMRGISYLKRLDQCPQTKFDGAEDRLFSQFYEDYILSYVFQGADKGFYVDVGAHHPHNGSATKYFHDKGWSGMNFEPQVEFYNQFLTYRPKDININKAVSSSNSTVILYIPDTIKGWAGIDPRIEQRAKSISATTKIEIQAITLTEAFKSHNISDIDFIKIDVEGHEDKVLEGLDFKTFRPKVFIIESSSPTNAFGYLNFEPIMLNNGYKLGMDDELNRYYYRQESPEFAAKFREIRRCVIMSKLLRDKFCQNEDYCQH
jgi:FkbM family methyltransferase